MALAEAFAEETTLSPLPWLVGNWIVFAEVAVLVGALPPDFVGCFGSNSFLAAKKLERDDWCFTLEALGSVLPASSSLAFFLAGAFVLAFALFHV